MIPLFLSKHEVNRKREDESAQTIIGLLNQLEPIVWTVLMSSGGRSEARLWLYNTVSRITSISPRDQQELFLKLLRSKPIKVDLVAQLLQMLFEKRPNMAGSILAKRSHLLEKFFQGNPTRILLWFCNFDASGGSDHKKGARALSQFAFVNRDICWEELEWRGKHGQSPAMVATKPHYFLDLDVVRTVENFVEYVPEFWSSNEFSESLKDGHILSTDIKYFVKLFTDLMFTEEARDVWELIDNFLVEETFPSLCQRLLITLEENDVHLLLKLLSNIFGEKMKANNISTQANWLEFILSKCSDMVSIDQLLIINALINQGRQLLRALHDEECVEEREKVKDIVMQISKATSSANSFGSLLEVYHRVKVVEALKLLGFQSWVLHYRLSDECKNPESWESLFISNGIKFRKSGDYTLLNHEDINHEEPWSDRESKSATIARTQKKEKKRKKRRRDIDNNHSFDDDLLDVNMASVRMNVKNTGQSWMLSTDGFSASWTMADLPEHLSLHWFSVWMNWVFLEETK